MKWKKIAILQAFLLPVACGQPMLTEESCDLLVNTRNDVNRDNCDGALEFSGISAEVALVMMDSVGDSCSEQLAEFVVSFDVYYDYRSYYCRHRDSSPRRHVYELNASKLMVATENLLECGGCLRFNQL